MELGLGLGLAREDTRRCLHVPGARDPTVGRGHPLTRLAR